MSKSCCRAFSVFEAKHSCIFGDDDDDDDDVDCIKAKREMS